MIRTTFAATPDRRAVVAAKVVLVTAITGSWIALAAWALVSVTIAVTVMRRRDV
ncbi:hypothetical protein [Streptomyces sp. NPDC029003]|uniref:hypothetical protein n=1 Tax=Streptomyces sp. NPDC029003 TaxID=3155125 RepID=UPI003400FFF3